MNGIAVSKLQQILLSKQQGFYWTDQLTWTVEKSQSTSVELQDIPIHQFKYFPHMSMSIEELAVFQQLRQVLADFLVRIE